MTRDFPTLQGIAARQAQVVTRAQLARLGADWQLVARRVAAGAWTAIGPRVVVLHTGTLTREQRHWVGYLHASLDEDQRPQRAALTRLSAAEAGGFTGFETDVIHVVVEHGRQTEDLRVGSVLVKVHESRNFADDDIHPAQSPPRLRLPRAVVEAASDVAIASPGRARALIAASVQQRLVRPADLRTVAVSRRTLPGRRLLLETIGDAQGGAHSLPEHAYLRGVRRTGLPEPRRQLLLQRADGRWYLDNDFTEYLVSVEINGIQHYEQTLREQDDLRRAVLQIGGRIVIDVSAYAVRHQLEQCMLLTAEALMAHGYQAPPATLKRLDRLRAITGLTPNLLQAS